MARQVLPIVGAVVGSFFGAPQIGFMIGSIVGNVVDPQVIKGPSIGDGQTQTSSEGVPRPIVYGTACVGGNIIDRSEIYKSIKRTRQGKGGGPVTEEERMHLTYAIRICEGPVAGLLRIWEDEKLVYDVRTNGQVDGAENAKFAERFRFYRGTEDQLPDPELEIIHGAGNAPSYRGTAYIVFPKNDVTDRRGSIPNYRFEVAAETTPIAVGNAFSVSSTFAGYPPGQLTQSGELDWQSSTTGVLPSSLHLHGVSPNGRHVVAIGSKSGKGVLLIQTRQTDGSFSLSHVFEHDEDMSATNAKFTPDGKHLLVCYDPVDDEDTKAGVRSVWETRRADNGTFSVVQSGQLPEYYCKVGALDWPTGGMGFSPAGNKLFCRLSYRSMSSTYATFAFFSMTAGGYLITNPENIAPYGGWSTLFSASSISWSPNGRYVVSGGPNWTHCFDSIYEDISLSFINRQSGGFGGAFFAASGNRVFLFDQLIFSNKVATIYDFDGTSGMHNPTPIFNPAAPNITYRFGSYTADRKYVSMGNAGTVLPGGRLGVIYKLDELAKTVDVHQVVTATNSQQNPSGTSLIFPAVRTSSIADGEVDNLARIIEDIADRCDIDLDNIDTSEVDGVPVRGFVLAQQYEGQNAIRSLQQSFFFDPGEWDEQVHFVPRGKDSSVLIPTDDMTTEPYDAKKLSAPEFPRKLELLYQNATIGYDRAKEAAERNTPSVRVSGTRTLEVPVVLNESEAAQVADKQLKIAWAEAQGEAVFEVSTEYDYLTPTDVIFVQLRDVTRRMRIEKIERADGVLKLTCKEDRQSAYTSSVQVPPLPPPTPPPPTITGPTLFAFLNIPALVDAHDVLGYYVAGTGTMPAWYGAVVERDIGDGQGFLPVATLRQGATFGYLLAPVAAASEHYPDTTNKIRVQLYSGAFESVSQETLLRENNAIAIQRPDGTAEILQIRDAEDLGDGVYELSYLIRGRLNSGATAHADGAVVVFLQDVELVQSNSSEIGLDLEHRATSYGESPEDSVVYEDTWAPALMQVEFPVDLLTVSLEGSNIAARWSPRERFGTDVAPVRSQNWQHYLTTFDDGITRLEVVSLVPEAFAPSTTFTGEVTVTVQQVNRFTGPGPGVSESIEV